MRRNVTKVIRQRGVALFFAQIAVVILRRKSYVFAKPVGRGKGIGGSLVREFHLCQYKGGQVAPEQVQFNGESVCKSDPVSSFPDQPAVHLGQKLSLIHI